MSDETARMPAAHPAAHPAWRPGAGGDRTTLVPPPPPPTQTVPLPTAPTEVVRPRAAARTGAAQADPGHPGHPGTERPPASPTARGAGPARIPATGEVLGPFQLGGSLGHGGFAHVYRATGQGREVALKVLTNDAPGTLDRFAGEAALLERLGGRGFPQLIAVDLQAPTPWFAMELVPGPTLAQRVASDGAMPLRDVLRVAGDVLDALAVLQEEHFLHRDVKPANIIAAPDRYVLIDLGIAKGHGTSTSTHAAGTISYMAPELFVRKPHARSDVYSLGLLLVFLATGELPNDLNFAGRDLTAADVGPVDQRLLPLVLAMTRHRPEDRPPLHNLSRTVAQLTTDSTGSDATLLDPSLLAAVDATAVERGLVTEMLTGSAAAPTAVAPTSVLASNPVRQGEPVTNLVYDQQLMGRLHQVHGDGFDGAAEEIISAYLSAVGPQRAGGRSPAEVKDYLWAAVRWAPAFTPEGYADSYDGWVAYRRRRGLPLPSGPATTAPPRQTGSPTRHPAPGTNQQATQVAPSFRPGPVPGARPAPVPARGPASPPAGGPVGGPAPSAGPAGRPANVPAQPPAQSSRPTSRRADRDAGGARDARDPGRGLGVVATVVGWLPRVLLALAVYQLVRLVPGFDGMPSAAGLPLFTSLGYLTVDMLGLDPVWAPRMAELSIPLLGIVTSALVSLFRAARKRRGARTWPFWLVVVVWVIVIAVQGVVGYAQQVTHNARESLEQQIEQQSDQIQDGLEQGVQDTTEDVRDSLWESFEDALPWN